MGAGDSVDAGDSVGAGVAVDVGVAVDAGDSAGVGDSVGVGGLVGGGVGDWITAGETKAIGSGVSPANRGPPDIRPQPVAASASIMTIDANRR